jgi:DNA-binding transcriptional regulator/RsmH inhibitor MraZ
VDGQWRATLPLQFAKKLQPHFFVAALPDWGHIGIFPANVWLDYVRGLYRDRSLVNEEFVTVKPFLGAHSAMAKVDRKGRFTIPENLRQYIEKKVVFVGALDTVRLYGATAWATKERQTAQLKRQLQRR